MLLRQRELVGLCMFYEQPCAVSELHADLTATMAPDDGNDLPFEKGCRSLSFNLKLKTFVHGR